MFVVLWRWILYHCLYLSFHQTWSIAAMTYYAERIVEGRTIPRPYGVPDDVHQVIKFWLHVWVYTHTHTHTHTYIQTHKYIHLHTHTHTLMYAQIHTHMHLESVYPAELLCPIMAFVPPVLAFKCLLCEGYNTLYCQATASNPCRKDPIQTRDHFNICYMFYVTCLLMKNCY